MVDLSGAFPHYFRRISPWLKLKKLKRSWRVMQICISRRMAFPLSHAPLRLQRLSIATSPKTYSIKPNMHISLRLLWLLPLISAAAWFTTLFLLLSTWLVRGRPYYPGQSNPYIACGTHCDSQAMKLTWSSFISDIAAFDLKWPFLIGCTVTSVFFILTIISVHFARYDKRMYGIQDFTGIKLISVASIASGVVAGCSLILLSILDTYRYHEPHRILLLLYFVGLGLCAFCTTFVYFDQTRKPSPFRKLRF
jgi:hypothetical protein